MLKAATSLTEVYKTLSPEPLVTPEELEASDKAILAGADIVAHAHARAAIDRLRRDYTRSLGHPLVVDVLKTQGVQPASAPGGTR